MNVAYNDEGTSKSLMEMAKQLEKKYKTIGEEDEWDNEVARDDVSGAALKPEEVRRARAEEIKYVHDMGFYEKVPIDQCHARTGKAPISTRWIDINKGDQESPNYRSRFVAREVNTHRRGDLFAAPPPLEALQIILSMTATSNEGEVVMINDISLASFHARAKGEVFVKIPKGDVKEGEEKMCGRLKYSMYGTRDAAQNWCQEYSGQLVKIGFEQGKASPCIFHHRERGIRSYVHGDDCVSIGKLGQMAWMKIQLENKYTVKTQILCPGVVTSPTVLGEVMSMPPLRPNPTPPFPLVVWLAPLVLAVVLRRSISTFTMLVTSITPPFTIWGLGNCPVVIAVNAHRGRLSTMCFMLLSGDALGDILFITAGVQVQCTYMLSVSLTAVASWFVVVSAVFA